MVCFPEVQLLAGLMIPRRQCRLHRLTAQESLGSRPNLNSDVDNLATILVVG